MSELVKCATCKTEKPVSEMQTCLHAGWEYSVCDMPCMIKFYKGEIKPDIVITPDLEEMVKLGMNPKEYHLHKENLELRAQLAKAKEDYKTLFSAFESCQDELKKANEREKRLEKILQRYESEQLQPLKLRVNELESAILDSCSTYHFEPDLSQPVSSLNELLIINSKWTLDPEISSDVAKFAIKQQIKGLKDYQALCGYSDSIKFIDARIAQLEEQLRKEQE